MTQAYEQFHAIRAVTEQLPESWPSQLAFQFPPSPLSPPFQLDLTLKSSLYGPMALDEANPVNQEYLQLETQVIQFIEGHQESDSTEIKAAVAAMKVAFTELQQCKQVHWERGRRTFRFQSSAIQSDHATPAIVVILAVVPLLLNILKRLSRNATQFLLHCMKLILIAALQLSPPDQQQLLINLHKLPTDPDHLHHTISGDQPFQKYIACPKCFALYDFATFAPLDLKSSLTQGLPNQSNRWTCTHRQTPDLEPCGSSLSKGRSVSTVEDQSISTGSNARIWAPKTPKPVPLLPFYVGNLCHWLGNIICRPQILHLLQKSMRDFEYVNDKDQIRHIMQGTAIQALRGADNLPFINSTTSELRICLGLFIDWFNSEGNHIGGKHKSTGAIYIVILNLPKAQREAPENMFPIFLPGGREPTTSELNHLLGPLVDQLITLYENGMEAVTSTHTHLILRAMLAIIIADTPAIKKIGGFASHAHEWFCHYNGCNLPRSQLRSSLDPSVWTKITPEEHKKYSTAWHDASTMQEQEEIFSSAGFRYSELSRLPYLCLIKSCIIEPMHTILLNTIQHHIRSTFGINARSDDSSLTDDGEEIGSYAMDIVSTSGQSSREVTKATAMLLRPGIDMRVLDILFQLKTMSLQELCKNFTIPTWELPQHKGAPKKIFIVDAIVRWIANTRSSMTTENFENVDISEGLTILGFESEEHATRINRLLDLSEGVLFEMCSLARCDTSELPLKRGSIFPDKLGMVNLICNKSPNDFNNRWNILDLFSTWKKKHGHGDPEGMEIDDEGVEENLPHINENFLKEIRRDIRKAEFPPELRSDAPPHNLGSAQHGRLKAAQWRVVCCFTLLFTLGRIWGTEQATKDHKDWFENYLHLVVVVRLAFSTSITQSDIKAFRNHSQAYVQGLHSYNPKGIKPCHHYLLHLADLLELYGPMREWWAFPFERLNGVFQHLNTNHQPGEIEKTYLVRWLQLAQVYNLLTNTDDKLIKAVGNLSDKYISSRFQLSERITTQDDEPVISQHSRHSTNFKTCTGTLSQGTITCIRQILQPPRSSKFTPLSSLDIEGSTFKPYRMSPSYGLVEYCNNDGLHPISRPVGYVEDIFLYHPSGKEDSSTKVFICISKCKGPSAWEDQGPYIDSPYCGARVVSRTVENCLLAEPQELKHVMRYPWGTNNQLIISVMD